MDPEKIKSAGAAQKKANKKFFQKLKKRKGGEVDQAFHYAHDEVFERFDCLSCANCCKTTGPLFTDKDIERIANHFRLKPSEFVEQYLRLDEDNDYVLQKVPCTFLDEDNYCRIYDIRPKACREYPHTDRRNMQQILNLTRKNLEICPAVQEVVEIVKQELS